jgi:hypothetical protein
MVSTGQKPRHLYCQEPLTQTTRLTASTWPASRGGRKTPQDLPPILPGFLSSAPPSPPILVPRETKGTNCGGHSPQASGRKPFSCGCLVSTLFLHCPMHCSLACHAAVCPGHPILTISCALLVPMTCRGHGSTHPKVTSPCPRDTCPWPASEKLAPFTDWINGITCQILKVVSKSTFFSEANKDCQSGSNGRNLPNMFKNMNSNPTLV